MMTHGRIDPGCVSGREKVVADLGVGRIGRTVGCFLIGRVAAQKERRPLTPLPLLRSDRTDRSDLDEELLGDLAVGSKVGSTGSVQDPPSGRRASARKLAHQAAKKVGRNGPQNRPSNSEFKRLAAREAISHG